MRSDQLPDLYPWSLRVETGGSGNCRPFANFSPHAVELLINQAARVLALEQPDWQMGGIEDASSASAALAGPPGWVPLIAWRGAPIGSITAS